MHQVIWLGLSMKSLQANISGVLNQGMAASFHMIVFRDSQTILSLDRLD
jgi:hypothetical protein